MSKRATLRSHGVEIAEIKLKVQKVDETIAENSPNLEKERDIQEQQPLRNRHDPRGTFSMVHYSKDDKNHKTKKQN